jgi:hypothetical protein
MAADSESSLRIISTRGLRRAIRKQQVVTLRCEDRPESGIDRSDAQTDSCVTHDLGVPHHEAEAPP